MTEKPTCWSIFLVLFCTSRVLSGCFVVPVQKPHSFGFVPLLAFLARAIPSEMRSRAETGAQAGAGAGPSCVQKSVQGNSWAAGGVQLSTLLLQDYPC